MVAIACSALARIVPSLLRPSGRRHLKAPSSKNDDTQIASTSRMVEKIPKHALTRFHIFIWRIHDVNQHFQNLSRCLRKQNEKAQSSVSDGGIFANFENVDWRREYGGYKEMKFGEHIIGCFSILLQSCVRILAECKLHGSFDWNLLLY